MTSITPRVRSFSVSSSLSSPSIFHESNLNCFLKFDSTLLGNDDSATFFSAHNLLTTCCETLKQRIETTKHIVLWAATLVAVSWGSGSVKLFIIFIRCHPDPFTGQIFHRLIRISSIKAGCMSVQVIGELYMAIVTSKF